MKNLKVCLFLLSSAAFAVNDYDQYDVDDAAEVGSGAAPISDLNGGKSSAPIGSSSGASIGFPTIEYTNIKAETREGVDVILPTNGKDIPSTVSKWNFGIRMIPQEDLEISLGVPILDSKDPSGSRTELGNTTIDVTTVWFQGKAPQPMKVDFLAHVSTPHRGSGGYYSHTRWDFGPGIGTSKRFGRAMFRGQGIYVFKKNASGASYTVGDMMWFKAAIAFKVTQELDFQVVGDLKRAFSLKEDGKILIKQANLTTISPQIIFHMNNTLDLMLGGTFVSNRGSFSGKEAAFGDISYDGMMGDQVTVGMGVEI